MQQPAHVAVGSKRERGSEGGGGRGEGGTPGVVAIAATAAGDDGVVAKRRHTEREGDPRCFP